VHDQLRVRRVVFQNQNTERPARIHGPNARHDGGGAAGIGALTLRSSQ
jgi:hypothetical protein